MKKNSPIDFRFVFQFVASLSLLIIYVFQWGTMIASPSLRTGTDFISYYAVGRISQDQGYSKAYDISMQQKVQEEQVGFSLAEGQVLLYLHVPYLLPILRWLVTPNYSASFIFWALLMAAVYAVGIFIFLHPIKGRVDSLFNFPLFIGMILFFPFFQSLLLGQDTALLFLGVVLWLVGMKENRNWLAAIGLALTSVRPHMCVLFALPSLFQNRAVAWRFLVAGGILGLLSFLLLGWEGTLGFVQILRVSAGGAWYGMNEADMFNLIGLASRLLLFLSPEVIRLLGWTGFAAGVATSILIWRRTDISVSARVGSVILLAMFFAPHLHYHDLTLLILPLALLSASDDRASYLPLGVSLLLLLLQPLYYILPYVLYVGLAGWLVKNKV